MIPFSAFLHIIQQDTSTVQIDSATAYRNPLNGLDTNGDGLVAAIDALLVINRLNSPSEKSLATPSFVPPGSFEYIDANGDNFVTAIDALLIINALNNRL